MIRKFGSRARGQKDISAASPAQSATDESVTHEPATDESVTDESELSTAAQSNETGTPASDQNESANRPNNRRTSGASLRQRRRTAPAPAQPASSDEDETSTDVAAADARDLTAKSAPEGREESGPLDESEANPVRPYIDLGSIKILPQEGLNLRLEVEETTKRIVAVSLDFAGSTLQVQPMAAPRSSGLWHETRRQIGSQLAKQGGRVGEREGTFGQELIAEIPAKTAEGEPGKRILRFIGVDGPRWMLRGVIAGRGAVDATAAEAVEDLFRSIVVVRGDQPMPPRDLLPISVPATATP